MMVCVDFDFFTQIYFTEFLKPKKLPDIEEGVHWCDDDENDKSVCSLLCQTGNYRINYRF